MSNLLNNRINTVATAAQIAGAKAALQNFGANLPFLIGLTKKERDDLVGIDVDNKAYVEDALNSGINNPAVVPSFASIPNMQLDLTLFNQLDELKLLINQLLERVEDTQLLAASEALNTSKFIYGGAKAAAEAGVPGADAIVALLSKRFEGQGNRQIPPAPPTS